MNQNEHFPAGDITTASSKFSRYSLVVSADETCREVDRMMLLSVKYISFIQRTASLKAECGVFTYGAFRSLRYIKTGNTKKSTILQYIYYLTFVCPCIVSIIVNDDQQDATILAYLFILNQLYVFRAVFAHHQEHLTVFTASDIVHRYYCCLVDNII